MTAPSGSPGAEGGAAPVPLGEAAEAAAAWTAAQAWVADYLEATGMEPAAAAELAPRVVAEARAGAAPVLSAEEAALAGLRTARRVVSQQAARASATGEGARPGTPAARPLAMPRRAFRSLIDWRLATTMIRRLLPAGAPRRRRRQPSGPPPGLHRLSGAARRRRLGFLFLITLTTAWGVTTFVQILGADGISPLDIAHTALFSVLLLWLAQSFWSLFAGAAVLAVRLVRGTPPTPPALLGEALPRTAIVLPIYNEGTSRVFAGVEAMWTALQRLPEGQRCDLFVLSDTTDPDIWLAELDAWQDLRASAAGGERIFYRRRLRNLKRKIGNIESFVTRWGGAYGYMLTLDADSLMTAEAMAELVRRLDANPDVGLIQAPPKLIRGHSLFARVLQFAGEVYGPLSAAGISYWALGEGNYWGHNAIIRTGPFAELCGLPLLPGRAPLGGEIMSHDFVEAALLRRGGWQVWIADDLGGSYEEPPPTIGDFATRDRRWCQGNLQHTKVLITRNLHWVSRLHLAIGVLSYVTSPLWLLFLLLSAAQAFELAYTEPVYFTDSWPFPVLPVSVQAEAALLLTITLGLLFAPKLFGLALALVEPQRRRALGGGLRLVLSTLLETLFSALLAPIMMLFHTSFVLQILLGAAIDWAPQRRSAAAGLLAETARRFGGVTAVGVIASAAIAYATPSLFLWLVPVLAGLVLAIPLVLLSSSEAVGRRLRDLGLLLIVEETRPPAVAQELDRLLARAPEERDLFAEAVLDPGFNSLHVAMLRAAGEAPTVSAEAIRTIERKAVYLGPAALAKPERRALLEHPASMARLHLAAWVHWRGERKLAWETDEPLPPIAASLAGSEAERAAA